VSSQGASRRRLQQELFKRGVTREVADGAIAEVWSDENVDDDAAVEASARKKLRALGGLDDATRRRRLYSFLARRGHESDAIRRAMAKVLATGGDADAGEDSDDGGED
jgi:regulatory protein